MRRFAGVALLAGMCLAVVGEEIEDFLARPKFKLIFSRRAVAEEHVGAELDRFRAPNGLEYACARVSGHSTGLAEAEKNDTAAMVQSARALLAAYTNNCVQSKIGWWRYEYCHGRHVMQFHQPGDKLLAYYLGKHPGAARVLEVSDLLASALKPRETAADADISVLTSDGRNYVHIRMFNGTICDVTNKPRTVDVRLMCGESGQNAITLVRETAVCHYHMEVRVAALCSDTRFRDLHPSYREQPITCNPVLDERDFQQWSTNDPAFSWPSWTDPPLIMSLGPGMPPLTMPGWPQSQYAEKVPANVRHADPSSQATLEFIRKISPDIIPSGKIVVIHNENDIIGGLRQDAPEDPVVADDDELIPAETIDQ